jgi:RHS repeat-associated protein
MRVAAPGAAGTLSYLLSDHLGSTTTVLNNVGTIVSSQTYWPYGGARTTSGALATDKQYTGQQHEAASGALDLYNYGARFYSTVLGRFLSADSSTSDGLNRYMYVRGNPMRYSDPTGHGVTVGDYGEGYCPGTHPDCVNDGTGPVGGDGGGGDNCPASLSSCGAEQPAVADVANPAVPYPVPVPPLPRLTPEQVQAIEDFAERVAAGAKSTGADIGEWLGGYTFKADTGDVPAEDVAPAPYAGSLEERIAKHAQEDSGRYLDENAAEVADRVRETMDRGESRPLARGRTAYYHDGTIVISDPRSPHGGTTYDGSEDDYDAIDPN